jgi:23S rRNA (cytidine1920-2'-O)/16S rRNA (cytidine1409-2'-O)-methyltransferase
VGRERVGPGGVVRDPGLRAEAVLAVADTAARLGLGVAGVAPSPLPGPSGNLEFFLWLRPGAPPPDPRLIRDAVAGPGAGAVGTGAGGAQRANREVL